MLKRMMLVMTAAVSLAGGLIAQLTAAPATKVESEDEQIIREAIARQLGKKPEELANEDYDKIKELSLRGTKVSDIEPLKGLSNLQGLSLYDTQVSNIEPLGGISKLQTLDLSSTQVSNQQIAELQKALPKLTIYR